MKYLPLRKAKEILGLHPNTLRKYADNNIIESITNAAGQRLFNVESYLQINRKPYIICYCRVSSSKQKDDLARQVQKMQELYPNAEIIQDVGSGLNFKRKGLTSLLDRLLQGDKFNLVVAHRDRLARFGFELFEYLIQKNGGQIMVLNEDLGKSKESELTEDLLAILHHFSCTINGRSSHQSKKNTDLSIISTENDLSSMVWDFKESLQRNTKSPKSS